MAEIIWTEPALQDLEAIADYIALDKPSAAAAYVQKVFKRIERLEKHPNTGKKIEELPSSFYREIIIPPCRIFYRKDSDLVVILHVMRGESLLNMDDLDR